MLNKILVPLDGSKLAEVALPYAEELASRLKSDLTLLYVDESESTARYDMLYMETIAQSARSNIAKNENNGQKKSVTVNPVMLCGHAAEAIVEHADKDNIDLIVMSTHGRSGLKRWALGSVADKVMNATRLPVVLIRAKDGKPDVREKGLLGKILVPLDGSAQSEVVLPYVEELAIKLKAEVVFMHVVRPQLPPFDLNPYVEATYSEVEISEIEKRSMDYLNGASSFLRTQGIKVRSEVVFGSVAESVISFADGIGAHLVMMASHGRTGVKRWIFGSNAARVLNAGNTPLMIVRTYEK